MCVLADLLNVLYFVNVMSRVCDSKLADNPSRLNILNISSIYSSRSGPMLIIFDQPLFELINLLLFGQSLLFKVETYCSRTGEYCYGVKTYYNQQ